MAKLSPRGAAIATPFKHGLPPRPYTEDDLRVELQDLCPNADFSVEEVGEYFFQLGTIIGSWLADRGQPNSKSLARTLSQISNNLDAVVIELSGHSNGLQTTEKIELAAQIKDILALHPNINLHDRADAVVEQFISDARKISHACRIASADLNALEGTSGRPVLKWHDEYTALLLSIAARSGVKPTLGRDASREGEWTGWLFRAATRLECFLPKAMQSETGEARGRRLERSKSRLNG
jgi:hypothetical protein